MNKTHMIMAITGALKIKYQKTMERMNFGEIKEIHDSLKNLFNHIM